MYTQTYDPYDHVDHDDNMIPYDHDAINGYHSTTHCSAAVHLLHMSTHPDDMRQHSPNPPSLHVRKFTRIDDIVLIVAGCTADLIVILIIRRAGAVKEHGYYTLANFPELAA